MKANLLLDRLPEQVMLGGRKFPLHTGFRRWILVSQLWEASAGASPVFGGGELARCTAKLVCPAAEKILYPAEVCTAFLRQAAAFLLMREGDVFPAADSEKNRSPAGKKRAEPLFDFDADAGRIYASFYAVYGLDLTKAALHWWVFLSLLQGLPQDSAFGAVLMLRGMDVGNIDDDGLRRAVRRARRAVRLGDSNRKGDTTWQMDRL